VVGRGFADHDRHPVLVDFGLDPSRKREVVGEVEVQRSGDLDRVFGFAVEAQGRSEFAFFDPFGSVDRAVVGAKGVVGNFAFALVEGVGGDRIFGGRLLDRGLEGFFDLFSAERPVVDPHLVDRPVEPFVEDLVGADLKGAFA
jgi:hypothetical protein